MTGVITSAGLGLFNSSANVLGAAGLLGDGIFGQARQRSYVNAATGNLILQSLDEQLSGRGADLFQQRTYNSLGLLNDGDGDGWRWDGERTVTFDGGAGKSSPGTGGTITRTDAGGHETTYTWDGTKYVSTDGDGAHDTVRFESKTANGPQWVWTDGTTRLEERYDANTGRLARQTDTTGNFIDYGYTDGRLTSITDHGSGQWIELVYGTVPGTSLIRLKQVNTHELVNDGAGRATSAVGAAIQRVEYNYDSNGRLTAVKTDLTPDNVTDNSVYITSYTYDEASGKISSVSQSDGTIVRFTYKQASASAPWRIDTVTDASGKQTFTYDDANHSTTISFDAGNGVSELWTYVYDTSGQLLQIKSPAPRAGDPPLVTTFQYETEADGAGHTGNVKRITDALGNAVTYGYDSLGNRILERDAVGDTITRTYNSANQIETETHYTVRDPDGDGAAQASGALVTRFVYDQATHTRVLFTISPEGRVTRNIYGTGITDSGLLTQTMHFSANTFNVSGLAPTQVPTEADMTAWLNGPKIDKTQIELTQIAYDLRGNVARQIDFATVNANGEGVLSDDKAASVTDFIYDALGFLRQTIAVRGEQRNQFTTLTSFDFDGLGRETKRVTAGATLNTFYDGAARTVTSTNEATKLVSTSTFDELGRLLSVSQSGNSTGEVNGPEQTRQTQYVYDPLGRLVMSQDAQGDQHFNFYNGAGQLEFTVDSVGAVCKYEYDADGRLVVQTHFADPVSLAAIQHKTTLVAGTDFDLTPLQDRVSRFKYDEAGHLVQSIDAANTVSTTTFDGSSRIRTQQTVDRVTRFLYDRDGLQVGVVDPLGYLTETRFDAAGRPIETIRYTHRSTAAIDESAPLWVGVQNQTITAYQTFSYRPPAIDADGDVLEFSIVGGKPDWLSFDKATGTLSGVPPMAPRQFTVTVRADDKRGKVSDVPITFTVTTSAPLWAQLPDVTVPLNTPGYVLELPQADNPQHTPLTYSVANPQLMPEGLSLSVVNGVPRITGTPTKASSAVITLQVSDGQLVTERSFMLSVISRGPTWLLDSRATPVAEGFINASYSFQVPAASDRDGEPLVYSFVQLPPGLSFDPATRLITGAPSVLKDSQLVVLQARDPEGNVTELRFGINVRQPNQPPQWDPTPISLTRSIGVFFDFTPPAATDPEGRALTYSADSLPPGLSIIPSTGRITGTPTQFDTNRPVTLTVTDSGGLTAQRTLFLTIEDRAPTVAHPIPFQPLESPFIRTDRPNQPIPPPYELNIDNVFEDFENQPLTYTAQLPSGSFWTWLSFDPVTHEFSGQIPVNTTHTEVTSVTLTATDPYGKSASNTFQIQVLRAVGPGGEPDIVAGPVDDAAVAISGIPNITLDVPSDVTVPEGDHGTIFTASSNLDVEWSLNGPDAALFDINFFTGAVTYAPGFVPDFDGQRDYHFRVNAVEIEPEEGGKKQKASRDVTLHVANLAPQISGVPDEIAFDEGTPTTLTLFNVGFGDPGGGFSSLNLSGDAGAFTIDVFGQVKFAGVPDFETKNRYVLTFNAADAFGATSTKSVVVDIRNVAPFFTAIPPASIEVDEGIDPNTNLFPVSALDLGGGPVTLSLLGADASAFRIVNGQVQFLQAPNFETKNTYTFTVRATDGAGANTDQSVTVKVRNVPPTISGVPVLPIEINEGFNAILFTAQASDPPAGTVGGLTFSLTGPDAAALTIDPNTGVVRFKTPPDFETKSSYAFTVGVTDGGGAAVTQSVTVNVHDVAPKIFGGSAASVPEGTPTSQWVYFTRATDGAGNLTYKLEGPDADDFIIDSLGLVYLKQVPNFETKSSYSFTVRATDGTTEVSQPVTLSITDIAPTISGPDSVDVQEESAGVIFAPTLNDVGGGPIRASLEGPDANLFTIDANTGEVRFRVAPDFGARNTFSFSVRVSDGTLSAVKAVTVHVTDLPNEDDLATWRPNDTEALHSYMFYDGRDRLIGSVDERGFLSATDYNDATNRQLSTVYLDPVTVVAGDTLDDLKHLAASGKSETTTTDFDSFGRVSKVTAVDGTTTRNVYDTASRLIRQIIGEGQFEADGVTSAQRSMRTRYNAFGDVTGVLSGTGDATLTQAHPNPTEGDIDAALETSGTRYEFDDRGLRIRSIDANGNVTRLFYDDEGQLTHTVNAKGEVSETHYNTFGQVDGTHLYNTPIDKSALDALTGGSNRALAGLLHADSQFDRTSSVEYDQRGLAIRSTDALGFVTTDEYTAYRELFRQTRTIQQAKDGNPEVTTTTRFDRDLDGQLISTTSDEGGINFNTQTGFDAYGRIIRSVDGAGRVTSTSYEDGGRTLVTSVVVDGQTRIVSDTFDAFSRVASHVDAFGNTTQYEFDDTHRKLIVTTPEGVKVTTVGTRNGEVFSVTDGRQSAIDASVATTRYTYDANGNVLEVHDALGQLITKNSYDASGRLETTQDARGTLTRFSYDELNRVVLRQVDPTGLNLTTKYEFDSFGAQMTVTEALGTAAQRVTRYSYDQDGQLTQRVVDPDGLKLATSYRYNGLGNTIQVSQGSVDDPDQQVTIYEFDGLGRRTAEIAAPSSIFGPGSSSTRDLRTEYFYDQQGNVSRRIDANLHSTWYVHNEAGELTDTIDASGALVHQDYDLEGRVIRERRYRDPLNTRYFGDVVTSVTPSPTSADHRSYFVYDKDDNLRFAVQAFVGNVWTVRETRVDADGNVTESRAYDKGLSDAFINANDPAGLSVDEVKQGLRDLGYKDQSLGSQATDEATLAKVERTRYAYDKNNQLRFTVDALGGVTENVHNAAGDVTTTVQYADPVTLSDFSESAISGALDPQDPDNRVTYFARDAAGRLRFVSQQVGSTHSQTAAVVTEYLYDDLDHVVETILYANATNASVDYTDATQVPGTLQPNNQDRISASVFDAAGREVYRIQASEVTTSRAGNKYVITKREFDDVGDIVKTTSFASVFALADLNKATVDGAVSAADDPDNRVTSFIYDPARRLHFTVAPDGSFSEDVLDGIGQLIERRQFDFRLSSSTPRTEAALIDARGARAVGDGMTRGERYTLDLQGHVVTTTDAAGNEERTGFDVFGNRASFIDKNGVALLKQHANDDPPFDLEKVAWSYLYDLQGNLIDEYAPKTEMQLSNGAAPTAIRLRTHYTRDAFGNIRAKIEALDTVDSRMTQYEYDTLNRQTLTTLPGYYDPTSGRVESTFAAGRMVRTLATTYNTFGEVVRTALATGPGANDVQYAYKTYDLLGHVVHDIDALGDVTYFLYNAFDEQTGVVQFSKHLPPVSPNADGLWTATEVETALGGNPLRTDAKARRVDTLYDNLGRKSTVTVQTTADPDRITADNAGGVMRYDYDAFGDIVHEAVKISTQGPGDFNGPGTWRNTFHYFNAVGQEVMTVDPLGYQTARSFDANGNLISVTEFANAGNRGVIGNRAPPAPTSTSPDDRTTKFYYDTLDRQVMVQRLGLRYVGAGGDNAQQTPTTVSQTTYDRVGNVIAQTDAMGNVTTLEYDALGWLTRMVEPARETAGPQVDPFRSKVTAAPVTTYTLNAFGQIVKQVRDPAGGAGAVLITVNTYDNGGNLVATTDANHVSLDNFGNTIVDHTFDKLRRYNYAGQVIEESQAIDVQLGDWQHVTETLIRRYAYDPAGRQIATIDVYAGGTQESGRRSVFDTFGGVTEEQLVWGAATSPWHGTSAEVDALAPNSDHKATVTAYEYDNVGHVDTQRNSGGVTKFFYNLAGQVTRQEVHGENVRVMETDYNERGDAITQRLPSFDAAFLSADGQSMEVHSSITPFVEQSFDRWGNVVGRAVGGYIENGQAQRAQQAVTLYHYNHDNQVVEEIDPVTFAVRENGTSYFAQITHVLGYDLLGHVVLEQDIADDMGTQVDENDVIRSRTREYNVAGQLTSETDAEQHTTSYLYDANGNRVATKDAHGTVFVDTFDKNGNMLSHGILRLSAERDGRPYVQGDTGDPVRRELNQYGYDQAGRRVRSAEVLDTIAFDQLTIANAFTHLDERGLVLETRNASNVLTRNEYDQFGLKTLEQIGPDSLNNVQTWNYFHDDFRVGRLNTATAGTNTTTYHYNLFGQVDREDYSAANNQRRYVYHSNGLLAAIEDDLETGVPNSGNRVTTHERTHYDYTVKGELASENFTFTGEKEVFVRIEGRLELQVRQLSPVTRSTFTTYDARGRVARVWAPNAGVSNIEYGYDEVGNVRHIGAPDGDHWFTYDKEGRITIADGELNGGVITRGTKGTEITYDELGRRATTVAFQGHREETQFINNQLTVVAAWNEDRLERYTYDDLSHLRKIEQELDFRDGTGFQGVPMESLNGDTGWTLQEERKTVDIRGITLDRQTYVKLETHPGGMQAVQKNKKDLSTTAFYREDGLQINQATFKDGDNSFFDELVFDYRDDGLIKDYVHITGKFEGGKDHTIKDTFAYSYGPAFGGLKEGRIDVTREAGKDVPDELKNAAPGSTVNTYDPRGRLSKVVISNPAQTTTRLFSYNGAAQTISVLEEVESGDDTKFGTQALFYSNGKQVATVGDGTLKGSHFSFAYTPITDASGPSTYTVRSGDTLASIARQVYGDPSLWYLIADANSIELSPDALLPPDQQGRTYRIPSVINGHNNADTFKPYNPAQIIGNTMPSPGSPPPPCIDTTRVLATVVSFAVQAVVTYFLAELGPLGAGIGAGAGDLVKQSILYAGGEQKGIDFDEVTGAYTKTTVMSTFTFGLATALGVDGTSLGDQLARQAISTGVDIGIHANDEDFDLGSSLFRGTVRALGTAAGPDLQTTNWNLGALYGDLADEALNPKTGWVFNEEARNWTNIVSQSLGAFTTVAVNAGLGAIHDYLAEQRIRDRDFARLSARIQGANFQLSSAPLADGYRNNRQYWNREIDAGVSDAMDDEDMHAALASYKESSGVLLASIPQRNAPPPQKSIQEQLKDDALGALAGANAEARILFKENGEVVLSTCGFKDDPDSCVNKALIDGIWHYVDAGTRFRGDYQTVYKQVDWDKLTPTEQAYELGWALDRPDRGQLVFPGKTLTDLSPERYRVGGSSDDLVFSAPEPVVTLGHATGEPLRSVAPAPRHFATVAQYLAAMGDTVTYDRPISDSPVDQYEAWDGGVHKAILENDAAANNLEIAKQSLPSAYDKASTYVHVGLAGLGMIPLIGVFADAVDFGLTVGEAFVGKSSATDVYLGALAIATTFTPGPVDAAAGAAKAAVRVERLEARSAQLAPALERAAEATGRLEARAADAERRLNASRALAPGHTPYGYLPPGEVLPPARVRGNPNPIPSIGPIRLGPGLEHANLGHLDELTRNRVRSYTQAVQSNRPWTWAQIAPGLSSAEKNAIKAAAEESGLVRRVPIDPASRFADFSEAVISEHELPEHLWHASDDQQFRFLDNLIGGRPEGTTWHHSEVPGWMQLIPFSTHSTNPHFGGRSRGQWATGGR